VVNQHNTVTYTIAIAASCTITSVLHAGITNEPNSVATTVDQGSSVAFTCEAEWTWGGIAERLCELLSSLNFESPDNLTRQLGLSLEWEIDGNGPFNSTEALTPTLIQRGITIISTNCTFNAEQLFHILEPDNERFCEQSTIRDVLPHCTSIINITRQVVNSNVQIQCSVQPSHECADGEYMSASRSVMLQLQGNMLCDNNMSLQS
jgi:hypothetical protein